MYRATTILRSPLTWGALVSCALSFCEPAAGQALIHTVSGQPGDDSYGRIVSGVGDFDGDGWRDFAVGTWNANPFGVVRVHSGADASMLHEFTGAAPNDLFGWTVDGGGDWNADGIPDIAIGAYYDSPGAHREGSAWVYSGGTGAVLIHLTGSAPEDYFGSAVAFIDDVNGDGHDELVVGATGDDGGGSQAGSATLFSGADGSVLYHWPGTAHFTVFGAEALGAGDVNGDGCPDVAVTALYSGMFENHGFVRVFSGRDGSLLHHLTDLTVSMTGSVTLGRLGDVDADGHDDLLTGSRLDNVNGPYSGTVRVFSGRTGAIIHSLHGTAWHSFGSGVDGVGDRDGDGVPDFAVGAQGTLSMYSGYVCIYSGQSGEELYQLDRRDPGNSFGCTVRSVGDVDHDGQAEVLVGAESADRDGQAMLYSSTCYRPETYCSLNPNSAGAGAKIGYFGLLSITANDFHLTVEDAPPGQFGLFLYGREENDLPFGDGYLCAGGGIARMELPGLTDGSGASTRQLDFLSMPASGPGHIEAASKRHFQFWFRDPNGPGGTGFNLSNGLRVQFCL